MVCSRCGIENAPFAETCRGCGALLNPKSTFIAESPTGTPVTQATKQGAVGCYVTAMKKYAVFTGRACRREFWYFFLFNSLILIALTILDGLIGTAYGPSPLGVLGGIFAIATMIPALAVSVRRLHDINLSGWLFLLALVPLVGSIILLLLCAQDSKPGKNQYGPSPKAEPDPSMPKPAPAANMVAGAPSNVAVAPVPALQTSSTPTPDLLDSHERVPPQVQAEGPTIASMIFCTKCGATNPADSKFCYSCGGSMFKPGQAGGGVGQLTGPTAPPTDHPTVPEDQSGTSGEESTAATGAKQGYPELPAEDKRIGAIIGAGVAVVVIGLLCVLMFLAVRSKSGPSSADSRENIFVEAAKQLHSGTSSAGTGENTVGAQGNFLDQLQEQSNRERSGISQTRNGGSSPRSTHGARTHSTTKAAPVHTLIDAQACTSFVQSDKPQEQISNLSGLKIERLAVYKAADGYGIIGWDVGYDIVNRTAIRGSQNSFAGFCVSGVTVDFKLRDSDSGEVWHKREDEGLFATKAVNSSSYTVKEYTPEPPVVLKATILSAVGIPVETARNLSSAQPSSGVGTSK